MRGTRSTGQAVASATVRGQGTGSSRTTARKRICRGGPDFTSSAAASNATLPPALWPASMS